jgi:preprotein translocase subunit Sss1
MLIENQEGKALNCKICGREAVEKDFCMFHLKAHENIVNKFEFWRKALKTSWKEYLSQIAKNSLTGTWVKEVAKYIIEHGETKNVRQS